MRTKTKLIYRKLCWIENFDTAHYECHKKKQKKFTFIGSCNIPRIWAYVILIPLEESVLQRHTDHDYISSVVYVPVELIVQNIPHKHLDIAHYLDSYIHLSQFMQSMGHSISSSNDCSYENANLTPPIPRLSLCSLTKTYLLSRNCSVRE